MERMRVINSSPRFLPRLLLLHLLLIASYYKCIDKQKTGIMNSSNRIPNKFYFLVGDKKQKRRGK